MSGSAAYGYDANGRKNSDRVALSYSGINANGDYTYFDDGRLKSSSAGTTETYSWSPGGDLTGVKPSSGATTTLAYGTGNRLSQMGTTLYGWDSVHGWRTSMKRSGESSVSLAYTGTGRLASYTDKNASRATTATYSYDAAGQRTASRVTTAGATVDKVFTYEGLTLLSVSATSSAEGTWSVTYLYDEEGRPYGGVYRESTATAVPFAVVANDRGDVLELLDRDGVVFAAYRYDAWGNPVASGTLAQNTAAAPFGMRLAARQPLRYAGYCWDAETGYYYLSARTYDPTTRQFLTKDPAKVDGEESAYQYCGGDPVGTVDPSGLFNIWVAKTTVRRLSKTYTKLWVFANMCHGAGSGYWWVWKYRDQVTVYVHRYVFDFAMAAATRGKSRKYGTGPRSSRLRIRSEAFSRMKAGARAVGTAGATDLTMSSQGVLRQSGNYYYFVFFRPSYTKVRRA